MSGRIFCHQFARVQLNRVVSSISMRQGTRIHTPHGLQFVHVNMHSKCFGTNSRPVAKTEADIPVNDQNDDIKRKRLLFRWYDKYNIKSTFWRIY